MSCEESAFVSPALPAAQAGGLVRGATSASSRRSQWFSSPPRVCRAGYRHRFAVLASADSPAEKDDSGPEDGVDYKSPLRARRTPRERQIELGASSKIAVTCAATEEDVADAMRLWTEAGFRMTDDDALDDAHDTEVVVARCNDGSLVGAGRATRPGLNVRLDRVYVRDDARGHGVGRAIVEHLKLLTAPIRGALYVEAHREELGFYSLLGFEAQGNEYMEYGAMYRHMVYNFPVCVPSSDCVGLHHTAIRVQDIERSLAFYGGLGFVVSEKFFTPAGARACFVEGLGVRLEFVESTTGSGVSGVQEWPGFLVFDVTRGCSDLDSYLDHLKRRNGGLLEIRSPPSNQVIGSAVMSIATVEDPDGLAIDFVRTDFSQTFPGLPRPFA